MLVLVIGLVLGLGYSGSGSESVSGSGSGSGDCESCHAAEQAEWMTSRHAAAWSDPIFQAEFAKGRPEWCVGCHATEADRDRGVGCTACHPGGVAADASPAACARCHEFNFPILGAHGRLVRYTDEPMQATVSQWRASSLSAAVECGDCHGEHGFRGSHDPDLVAGALALEVCRGGRDRVVVTATNRGAGHNIPSGGVHRRIALRVWRSSAPERLHEDALGRRFRVLPDGGKETTSDTTIPPGGAHRAEIALDDLGGAADEPLNVELRYVYALDEAADLGGAVLSRVIHHRRDAPADLPPCGPTE
ncbi:MAG TPA: hypothetical protein VMZ28_22445 [Kofleriaceae bacterium]|nr:hypothetical protein [Kofleriaceae bacterium]